MQLCAGEVCSGQVGVVQFGAVQVDTAPVAACQRSALKVGLAVFGRPPAGTS